MRRSTKFNLVDGDDIDEEDFVKIFKRRPRIVRKNHVSEKSKGSKKWNMKMYKKRNNVEHYHNANNDVSAVLNR